jgi:Flp pilus assembly protein TadG
MGKPAPSPGQANFWRRLLRSSEGTAAVEFVLVFNLLFIMIMGMLEFGLAFSMRQVIINASREGARYGITFTVNAQGNRVAPTLLIPSISNWVLDPASGGLGLRNILPQNSNPQVQVSGNGATNGQTGSDLRVTVSCEYPFFIMNKLLPLLGEKMQLTATTVMRVE